MVRTELGSKRIQVSPAIEYPLLNIDRVVANCEPPVAKNHPTVSLMLFESGSASHTDLQSGLLRVGDEVDGSRSLNVKPSRDAAVGPRSPDLGSRSSSPLARRPSLLLSHRCSRAMDRQRRRRVASPSTQPNPSRRYVAGAYVSWSDVIVPTVPAPDHFQIVAMIS